MTIEYKENTKKKNIYNDDSKIACTLFWWLDANDSSSISDFKENSV